MQIKTQSLLQKLDNLAWFASVGRRDIGGVVFVASWMDGMAHCVGSKWSNALIESSNSLSEKVLLHSKQRYDDWPTLDCEIRPVILELAKKKPQI